MPMKIFALAALLFAAIPASAQNTLVNANTASEAQIAAVPGLAPLAAAIVAKRPYASPLALDAVLAEGKIAPDQRKLIYTRFWAPMNLNTATLPDIMLIPGMCAYCDEHRGQSGEDARCPTHHEPPGGCSYGAPATHLMTCVPDATLLATAVVGLPLTHTHFFTPPPFTSERGFYRR